MAFTSVGRRRREQVSFKFFYALGMLARVIFKSTDDECERRLDHDDDDSGNYLTSSIDGCSGSSRRARRMCNTSRLSNVQRVASLATCRNSPK